MAEPVEELSIVALDAQGRPRFQLLQEGAPEAILVAFDLLWLDGQDLRGRPLDERRDLLISVMSNLGPSLRVSERIEGSAKEALARVAAKGLEGLMLKRRGSTYVGSVGSAQNQTEQTRRELEESLKTHRELARKEPESYLPYVAAALNDLGILDSN